jgi:hypothetical protein
LRKAASVSADLNLRVTPLLPKNAPLIPDSAYFIVQENPYFARGTGKKAEQKTAPLIYHAREKIFLVPIKSHRKIFLVHQQPKAAATGKKNVFQWLSFWWSLKNILFT